MSQKTEGSEEVAHLIRDGVVLFVCVAIIGAVLFDLVLSGYTMQVSRAFMLPVVPFIVVSLVSVNYILIIFKHLDTSCFKINSWMSITVINLSLLYSVVVKAYLYLKEQKNQSL